MRTSILFLLLLLPYLGITQDLLPEAAWEDGRGTDWPSADPVFYNFNSKLMIFTIKDSHPHVYYKTLDDNSKANIVDYKVGTSKSNVISDFTAISDEPNFAFEWNNQLYFYNAWLAIDPQGAFLDENMAIIPFDTTQNFEYRNQRAYPILNYAAEQLDTNLFFLAYNDETQKWCMREYFQANATTINERRRVDIEGVPGNTFGGLIRKVDSLSSEYFVLNTYDAGGSSYIGKLIPFYMPEGIVFYYMEPKTVFNSTSTQVLKVSRIAEGSLKGDNYSTETTYPQYSDRINVFNLYTNQTSSGTVPVIDYHQYYSHLDLMTLVHNGKITLVSGTTPYTISSAYRLTTCYDMLPKVYGGPDSIPVNNGYQSRLWLFYPFSAKNISGIRFTSDFWRKYKSVTSSDLSNTMYPGIQDLWTLIGITDGAPPVPMNWDTWYTTFPQKPDASSLEFAVEHTKLTEVATTTDQQWSAGLKRSMKASCFEPVSVTLDREFKYTHTYKQKYSTSSKTTIELTTGFERAQSTQDKAAYIYSIPIITRYSFSVFPWWDPNCIYPVENAVQYMYSTEGYSIISQSVPISSQPFSIANPNDSAMTSWSYAGRPYMDEAIATHENLIPYSFNWQDGSQGQSFHATNVIGQTTTTEKSNTFDMSIAAGVSVNVPLVFKSEIALTGGYDITYGTENTSKTSISSEFTVSYKNLLSREDGIKVENVNSLLYFFTPDADPNWWFYQYLGGQKPWYLAYISWVNPGKLNLVYPQDEAEIGNEELVFQWEPEGTDLTNYTLFISTTPSFKDILCKVKPGNDRASTIPDFKPLKDQTYYWIVKGYNDENRPIWSNSRSFRLKPDESVLDSPQLKLSVYPIPGSLDEMTISIQSEEGRNMKVRLVSLQGVTLSEKTVTATKSTTIINFKGLNVSPGVYMVVASDGTEEYVKKIMVK